MWLERPEPRHMLAILPCVFIFLMEPGYLYSLLVSEVLVGGSLFVRDWRIVTLIFGSLNIGSTPLWRCLDYFKPWRAKPEGLK